MTLNNILEAVASKLTAIWPEHKVYIGEIPNNVDGQFFVGIIESRQDKRLDRRRKRSVQLEILYFLKSKNNMDFNMWAEEMYDNFETMDVKENAEKNRTIRLKNQQARPDENTRVYQFIFDADFYFVLTPEETPYMEVLDQTEVLI